jgi:toluene monooxygenase system protein D
MPEDPVNTYNHVGPVLQAGALTSAIVAAIRDLNSEVIVVDRGAYLRVLAPRNCVVTRVSIEQHLGRPVRFPGELETVMSAFKGAIRLSEEEASWHFKSGSEEHHNDPKERGPTEDLLAPAVTKTDAQ